MQEKETTPDYEEPEGLDQKDTSWGDYPLDDLLIRPENRTVHDVIRRIDQSNYIMDPDFQRDFIWPENKQSKLVESVIMRIPLPVFYIAEDDLGRMVVVDGLQRLSTFHRFVKDKLRLNLPDRIELNSRKFSDLPVKIQNRVEDCNLIFYVIDSKVPERARDRVGRVLAPVDPWLSCVEKLGLALDSEYSGMRSLTMADTRPEGRPTGG